MLGGILKLTLFFNVFFLFIILLWQTATTNASPILAINDNLAKTSNDVSHISANKNNHKGALRVKRSLHSAVDQLPLIDSSRIRSSHHRRFRKKIFSNKLKNFSNIFQSTGTKNNHLRTSKRIKTAGLDDRLKRFRMLDPDEFQEMLNSFSYHNIPEQPLREFNNMDTIGGMQLENYWSRK